ncbi:MAG: hypothetical protein JXR48_14885 [Candidatus Delongbacteria bacterium]|nr:hypothetical protein [Candidatus Delongbacteria bacterium]MBN2836242.1 hypothetical protein [Candidatus Delongbacteria bacterium]
MKRFTLLFILTALLMAEVIQVRKEQSNGLVLSYDINGKFKISEVESDNSLLQKLEIEDFWYEGEFPYAEYPTISFPFAVPDENIPELIVSGISNANIRLTNPVSAAFGSYEKEISVSKYIEADLSKIPEYPNFRLVDGGYFKGYHLVYLKITPYDFANGKLITSAQIKIDYKKSFRSTLTNNFTSSLLNANTAGEYNKRIVRRDYPDVFKTGNSSVKLGTKESGFYAVSYSDLSEFNDFKNRTIPINKIKVYMMAGPDITRSPITADLNPTKEVPRRVVDSNENSLFDEGDKIEFYSPGRSSYIADNTINDLKYLHTYGNDFSDESYFLIDVSEGSSNGIEFPEAVTQHNIYNNISTFYKPMLVDDKKYSKKLVTTLTGYQNDYFTATTLVLSNDTPYEFEYNPGNLQSDVKLVYSTAGNASGTVNIKINNVSISNQSYFNGWGSLTLPQDKFLANDDNKITITKVMATKDVALTYYALYSSVNKIENSTEYIIIADSLQDIRLTFDKNVSKFYDISDPTNVKCSSIYDNKADLINKESSNVYIFVADPILKTVNSISEYSVFSSDDDPITFENLYEINNGRASIDYLIITPSEFYTYMKNDESELMRIHKEQDDLNSFVVNMSDIAMQFGRGYQEPAATRNFIKYAHENYGTEYVLLVGDGTYDYRNTYNLSTKNHIYPFETADSNDGLYANLYSDSIGVVHVSIGRFVANNSSDLSNMCEKTVEYMKNNSLNIARMKILVTSDDEHNPEFDNAWEEKRHTVNTENLIVPNIPDRYLLDKLYMIDYPFVFNSSSANYTKPAAENELVKKLNEGTNVFVYVGHGSPMRFAHEDFMKSSTVDRLSNHDPFLLMAASCSVGKFEEPTLEGSRPILESMVTMKKRGAVSALANTRSCSSNVNETFFGKIFHYFLNNGECISIGEALTLAKNKLPNSNNSTFLLFGDPALKLFKDYEVIQTQNVNTVHTLQLDSISTQIDIDSRKINGELLTVFSEGETTVNYTSSHAPYQSIDYKKPGKTLFKGVSSIIDKNSNQKFILPKDFSSSATNNIIRFYGVISDTLLNVSGIKDDLLIEPGLNNNNDITPPEITIKFNNSEYKEGDPIGENTVVYCEFYDESGINISSTVGHKIEMEIDGINYDLTPTFSYYKDSYKFGYTSYSLTGLKSGSHRIKVSAWDSFNNYNEKSSKFEVTSNQTGGSGLLGNVLAYPSPAKTFTWFTMTAIDAITIDKIKIDVYTVNGRKIKTIRADDFDIDDNFIKIYWNLKDDDGDIPANGVYIYKVKATYANGKKVEKKGKLIIAK